MPAAALLAAATPPTDTAPPSAAGAAPPPPGFCTSCATRAAKELLDAAASAARAAATDLKSADAFKSSTPEAAAGASRRREPAPAPLLLPPATLKRTAPEPVSAASVTVTPRRPADTRLPGDASQAASAPATADAMALRTVAFAIAAGGCMPASVKERPTEALPVVAEGVAEGVTDAVPVAVPVGVGVGVALAVVVALSDGLVVAVGDKLVLGVSVADGVMEGVPVCEMLGVAVIEPETETVGLDVPESETVGLDVAAGELVGEPVGEEVGVALAPALPETLGELVGLAPALPEALGEPVGVALAPRLPEALGELVGDAPAAWLTVAARLSVAAGLVVAAGEDALPGDGDGEGSALEAAKKPLKRVGFPAKELGHCVMSASLVAVTSAFVAGSRAIQMHDGKVGLEAFMWSSQAKGAPETLASSARTERTQWWCMMTPETEKPRPPAVTQTVSSSRPPTEKGTGPRPKSSGGMTECGQLEMEGTLLSGPVEPQLGSTTCEGIALMLQKTDDVTLPGVPAGVKQGTGFEMMSSESKSDAKPGKRSKTNALGGGGPSEPDGGALTTRASVQRYMVCSLAVTSVPVELSTGMRTPAGCLSCRMKVSLPTVVL